MVEDAVSGKCFQMESFGGPEQMKKKTEQVYLGDLVSADGKHPNNANFEK